MNYTGNFNLKKPESTDSYNIDDFNENADKIDEQLSNLSNPVFDEINSISVPVSGDGYRTTFGKIKKAISSLISHLSDKNNPHTVTAEQAGAAKESHLHKISDISDIDSVHNVTSINYSDFITGKNDFKPGGFYEISGKMVTGTITVSVNVTNEMIENEGNGFYSASIGEIASGYKPATIKYVPVIISKKLENGIGLQLNYVLGVIFPLGGVALYINKAVSGTAYIPISYLTA